MPSPTEGNAHLWGQSTDTDTCSDSPALGERTELPATRRRACLAALASAGLAGVAGALLVLGQESSGGDELAHGVISRETLAEQVTLNTGCGNWRSIAFHKPIVTESEDACTQACINTPGCLYANFQDQRSGEDGCLAKWQNKLGSCYTFGGECVQSDNRCWNLIKPKAASLKPPNFELVATGTGCSNWNEAKIGTVTMVWSHLYCSWLCSETKECVQFNFQPKDGTGTEQVGAGACYIFNAACVQEKNEFWDLYSMNGGTSTPPPAGTTTA